MRLKVKVQPGSKTDEVTKLSDGTFRVQVKAPARQGKANQAVVKTVARFLGIPKSSVRLVAGQRARNKILEIPDQT